MSQGILECYFAILDTIITSVKERCEQMEEISQVFGFLYAIAKVLEHCQKLASALEYNGHCDIIALELTEELKASAGKITAGSSPKDVIEFNFLPIN